MAAPNGNKNALGNRGGGRRKAGDIKLLWALWDGKIKIQDVQPLEHKKYGKVFKNGYSAFCYDVLTGDIRSLRSLIDKLFPNPRTETEFIDYDNFELVEDMTQYTDIELDEIIAMVKYGKSKKS